MDSFLPQEGLSHISFPELPPILLPSPYLPFRAKRLGLVLLDYSRKKRRVLGATLPGVADSLLYRPRKEDPFLTALRTRF